MSPNPPVYHIYSAKVDKAICGGNGTYAWRLRYVTCKDCLDSFFKDEV